ncbi:hypothetical protein ACFPRL_15785 [Pseudoclavibacter helvolus]
MHVNRVGVARSCGEKPAAADNAELSVASGLDEARRNPSGTGLLQLDFGPHLEYGAAERLTEVRGRATKIDGRVQERREAHGLANSVEVGEREHR